MKSISKSRSKGKATRSRRVNQSTVNQSTRPYTRAQAAQKSKSRSKGKATRSRRVNQSTVNQSTRPYTRAQAAQKREDEAVEVLCLIADQNNFHLKFREKYGLRELCKQCKRRIDGGEKMNTRFHKSHASRLNAMRALFVDRRGRSATVPIWRKNEY